MAKFEDQREPFYRLVNVVMGFFLNLMVSHKWIDQNKIPKAGGIIVVANHISYFDPPQLANFLLKAGRSPRFLAKVELFKVPFIGWVGRKTGQIPVLRNSAKAQDALKFAAAALAEGKCIAMYPEGTVTADPEVWPMTMRPGAVRLAMQSGAPLIPVGQWGANFVMPGKRPGLPRLIPRKTVYLKAGDPVEISDLANTPEGQKEACRRVADAITKLVAELRGEEPPQKRYDIRLGYRV